MTPARDRTGIDPAAVDPADPAAIDRPAIDPAVADWLRLRSQDAGADAIDIVGIRRYSVSVNERIQRLVDAPAWGRQEGESELTLPGPGGPLAARVFRPPARRGGDGGSPGARRDSPPSHPTIVHFHGGGWIAGDPATTHLLHCREWSRQADAVVLSVDYRLAPEHRFPRAFEDCLAATRWAAANIDALGGDPSRLIVAGDSAGAQLAASVAIACRDEGLALAAQALIAPVTDCRGLYQDPEINALYPSRARNATGYGLTTAAMADYAARYGVIDGRDWRASPLMADLRGVAPAVIATAGFDALCDEGDAYARKLSAAGVVVRHRNWPTLNHGFFSLGPISETARGAVARCVADVVALAEETRWSRTC